MEKEFLKKQAGKVQDLIKVEGTHVKMPMTIISGEQEGPTIFVTAGIHGSEYVGSMAMIELAGALEAKDIKGRLIALHPVNSQALWARISSILPEDGGDLNLAFPGKADGGIAEKTAWRISEFQDLADFYLDLHSGDLFEDLHPCVFYPKSDQSEIVKSSRNAAELIDVEYIIASDNPHSALLSGANRGIAGLMLARGGGGDCSQKDLELYKKDIINLFKHLGLIEGEPRVNSKPLEELSLIYLKCGLNALWRPEVEAGEEIKAGQSLGRLIDFFGKTVEMFKAERDGRVICKLRSLAANAGDTLLAY